MMSLHRLSLAQERRPRLPSPFCSRLMWSWRLHKQWCWLLPESWPNRWKALLIQVCYSTQVLSLSSVSSNEKVWKVYACPLSTGQGCVCQWRKVRYQLGEEEIKTVFIPVSSKQWDKDCFMIWAQIRINYFNMIHHPFCFLCSDSWAQMVFFFLDCFYNLLNCLCRL